MALDAEEIPFSILSAEQHSEQLVFDTVGHSELLTDLNQGGIGRAILEALGIQFEQLESKMFYGLERGILTSLYTAFNFPRLGASKASGIVTFNRVAGTTSAINIPVGTALIAPATPARPQVLFATTSVATMASNKNWVEVPVASSIAGSASNVAAGRINAFASPIDANIASIINYSAIRSGADQESEKERAVRFLKYISSLQRATLAGIEAGALTAQLKDVAGIVTERVQKAIAIEPANTLGRVDVFVDNGGGTASSSLITEAQRIINGYYNASGARVGGYKAAGIVAVVQAIISMAIPVTVKIKPESGYDFALVKVDVEDAIEIFFHELAAGTPLILVDLISAIATVPGVADLILTTPIANLNVGQSQRILAGTVTVTETI